jgi:hypothetical protein
MMRVPARARPPAFVLVASVLLFGAAETGFAPVLAAVTQDPGLAAGIRQVEEGDFEGAVATLGPVADRLSPRGGPDAAQACLYLGIAHLALDQRDAAGARFREALGHEPSLRLGPDRFSPKVIAAFEEARREREAAARAAAPSQGTKPEAKKGHAGRTVLIAGGAVAAGVGIALAAGGGGSTPSAGDVTFAGARFGTPVLDCPNGTSGMPLPVAIDLSAENGTGSDVAIGSVSAVLIIVSSPGVPSEVGFSSHEPATVVPATLRPGTTALRVQTTLSCANGPGDAFRFNEWTGRVTLAVVTAQTVETADTMRVNLP